MLIIGWCWFQSPNSGYPITKLCLYLELVCYVPRMALIPLSFSLPRDYPAQAPFLQNKFPRVHLSPPLAFSPSVFSLFANPPPDRDEHQDDLEDSRAPKILLSIVLVGMATSH